jgi:hypothetical protein
MGGAVIARGRSFGVSELAHGDYRLECGDTCTRADGCDSERSAINLNSWQCDVEPALSMCREELFHPSLLAQQTSVAGVPAPFLGYTRGGVGADSSRSGIYTIPALAKLK